MVETRRTSRRLQAKAAATTASPSIHSPSITNTDDTVHCDTSLQKKQEEEEKKKKEDDVNGGDIKSDKILNHEIPSIITGTEEDDEDEEIDRYAFLAALGVTLPPKATALSSSSVSSLPSNTKTLAATKFSPTAHLTRRLVPNRLDSGASQYQEYFNFADSKRSTAAALRADASAVEEAKLIAAGQKAVAHSERQRAESQHIKSAGRRWFNFESEEMTADARRDFALLRMRNFLDPKKFYKSSDHSRTLPKHFQMGVVIQGANEFYSARLTKKQRRKTFTDEIMADEAVVQYTHRVASNIQAARSSQGSTKRRRRY